MRAFRRPARPWPVRCATGSPLVGCRRNGPRSFCRGDRGRSILDEPGVDALAAMGSCGGVDARARMRGRRAGGTDPDPIPASSFPIRSWSAWLRESASRRSTADTGRQRSRKSNPSACTCSRFRRARTSTRPYQDLRADPGITSASVNGILSFPEAQGGARWPSPIPRSSLPIARISRRSDASARPPHGRGVAAGASSWPSWIRESTPATLSSPGGLRPERSISSTGTMILPTCRTG